ncbi:hypothetical protein DES53_12026 [Roseimicrobium gellanilyticum]|uniref:Uncharacterized protein n=2 Tax=Roseimicrobium TaxID=1348508 RepID=A0A366H1L2_9BACT|nr:hypothetical protein [Roseimicrobium gellanilyticum]RBP35658.1 hypothetical protein DES53_12026 [Roseimicrobium gellanilyticum]
MKRRIVLPLSGLALFLVFSGTALVASASEVNKGVREFREAYASWNADAFAQAAGTVSKAAASDGASAEVYHWLGVIQFHQMLQKRSESGSSASTPAVVKFREAAIETLTRALQKDAKDAEAHAMLGTMMGMKVDGMLSGLRFGPSISRHQDQALAHGTDNPRVQYLLGAAKYHTAKDKDGFESALKSLQTAERLFETENKEPAGEENARWGYDACLVFLGRTEEALGNREKAAGYFRKALSVRPNDDGAKEGLKRTASST